MSLNYPQKHFYFKYNNSILTLIESVTPPGTSLCYKNNSQTKPNSQKTTTAHLTRLWLRWRKCGKCAYVSFISENNNRGFKNCIFLVLVLYFVQKKSYKMTGPPRNSRTRNVRSRSRGRSDSVYSGMSAVNVEMTENGVFLNRELSNCSANLGQINLVY